MYSLDTYIVSTRLLIAGILRFFRIDILIRAIVRDRSLLVRFTFGDLVKLPLDTQTLLLVMVQVRVAGCIILNGFIFYGR